MARSVAIIGAGQVAHAAKSAFVASGWRSTIYARSAPAWELTEATFARLDKSAGPAPQADVIVDTIAFDAEDVDRYDPGRVGRLILVSSASVYCDAQGRTLDEARETGFPEFDGPIPEEQQTVPPGPETYSTRKIRMEQRALELFGERATILRPCAIYGPYSRHPREWWFVKRLLDGRTKVPLVHPALSRFQPTDADDIGRFAMKAAERELEGIFNVSTNDSPDVQQIGRTCASVLGRQAEFVEVDGSGLVGRTPWSIPRPFMVGNAKAKQASGLEFGRYRSSAHKAVGWLAQTAPADWREAFPQLADYPWDLFDYAAEDRVLAGR